VSASPPGSAAPSIVRRLAGRLPDLAVALALALAFLAREAACHQGLPYLLSWDEFAVAGAALDMLKRGSLDPLFYGYGALQSYVTLLADVPYTAWLLTLPPDHPQALASLEALQIGGADSAGPPTSHPGFYYLARLIVALLGTLTVWTTAILGRRLAGPWAGAAGALVLAAADAHASQSGFAVPNVPMALLATLVALATLAWKEAGRGLWIAWGLVGATTALKVTGMLTAVMPIAAMILALRQRRRPSGRELVGLIVAPLVFLAANPLLPFRIPEIVAALGIEARAYFVEADPRFAAMPGVGQLRVQGEGFLESFGALALALAAIGLARVVQRKDGWIAWLFPLVVLVFFALPRASFHRNLLLAYPFVAVLGGIGAVAVTDVVQGRFGRGASVGWIVVAADLIGGRAVNVALGFRKHVRVPDPRSAMADALARYPDIAVGLPDELRFHPSDVKKLAHPVVGPFQDVACSPKGGLVIVPFHFQSRKDPDLAFFLNDFLPPTPQAGGKPAFPLDEPAWNIPLRVLPVPNAQCSGFLPLSGLENLTHFPIGESRLRMLWNGPVALQGSRPAGWYEVVWEVRGRTRGGLAPQVSLDAPGREELRGLSGSWQDLRLQFELSDTTDLGSVRLRFVNDGAEGFDRDVELRGVWLFPMVGSEGAPRRGAGEPVE
jgi:hypothetical protein